MATPKIVMFTQAGCKYCAGAKEYLSQHGIDYVERNISRDQSAFDDLRALGYRTAPIIFVGDQVVIGFNVSRLEELLRDAGITPGHPDTTES